MRLIFLSLFFSLSLFASADDLDDYEFKQERMLLAEDGIYVISSLDSSDSVNAYSYFGDLLWERSFHAKIVSWQVVGSRIIVFSKHRLGHKTYLTCLDRFTGAKLWQKP